MTDTKYDLPQVPVADAIRTTLALWEPRAAEHPGIDQLLNIIRTWLYYLEQENAKNAADLATAREVARGNKAHVAEMTAAIVRIEALLDTEYVSAREISRALNPPAGDRRKGQAGA